MKTNQIFDSVENQPLDTSLLELREQIKIGVRKNHIRSFSYLGQLGLTNQTATIEDIIKLLPFNSEFKMDVYTHKHLSIDVPISGCLQVYKGDSDSKAYVEFNHERITLYRGYNTYYKDSPLQNWYAASGSIFNAATDLGSLPIANMIYHFSASHVPNILNKPPEATATTAIATKKTITSDMGLLTYTQLGETITVWQAVVNKGVVGNWTLITNP